MGKTERGKRKKLVAIGHAAGLRLAVRTMVFASKHQVALVDATINAPVTVVLPERVVGELCPQQGSTL